MAKLKDICTDRRAGKHGNGCTCRIIREEELLEMVGDNAIKQIKIWNDGRYEIEE